MQVVGLDIGFGFTKATNGRESLTFKSIFGEASDIQFREQFIGQAASDDQLHVEIDGTGYFVGEFAERQSNVRSFTLDQDQLIGNFAKILALAALSRMAPGTDVLRVVTGLPISYYRRHREELTAILQGKHSVVRVDAHGKSESMTININQARVIPQPFGSLFNAMMSNSAEVSDKRFVQEKIGIIDIGFRTCDYSIADKTRYSERGSRTTDSGIAQAFSIIASNLQDLTGIDVELYRLYEAVARGSIKIRGKTIDLKPITGETFGKLASSIAGEVDRLWSDDWDIDLIVVTGGGGAVLAPHLQPLLSGEILAIDPATDSRLNNVRGYWKYGLNLWGREMRKP